MNSVYKFDFYVEPEDAFASLFSQDKSAVWLDSSLVVPGLSRYSYLGGCSIPGTYSFSYRAPSNRLAIMRPEAVETREQNVFQFLRESLGPRRSAGRAHGFHGGFCGYLGYELKAECGFGAGPVSSEPDAQFLYLPAVLEFDRVQREMVLFVADPTFDASFFKVLDHKLRNLRTPEPQPCNITSPSLRDDPQCYREKIGAAQQKIRSGESYEVCLTNSLGAAFDGNPFDFYRELRRRNPAPYSAFMRFGELALACSSPERFLRIDGNGVASSKPIKGTVKRAADPGEDEGRKQALVNSLKDRAEHLMIVDLVRNDLGKVAKINSVNVPQLATIESYATVHQLVSNIEAELRTGCDAIDAIQATFPPGSMTGAPKHRTLEILDELEGQPRGIYSGAAGYIGLDGCVELNVVIRSAVFQGNTMTVGTGGAITALSEPASEIEETLVKLGAVVPDFAF